MTTSQIASNPVSRSAQGHSVASGKRKISGYLVVFPALAIAAIAAPAVFSSAYELDVLISMVINAILATGLAIVVRSGRMSLAQATFGGIGGYTSGILMMQHDWPWWPAWVAAGGVGAVFGVLLGLTSLRLRGFYFAIATFTFSLIAIQVLSAWRDVTGGLSGMFGLPIPPDLFGYDWLDPRVYYYFGLVVAAVTVFVYYLCTSGSRFGRRLKALGEDEIVAGSIGVNAARYRITAFAIASAIAGLGGSLSAHFIGGISPADIVPSASVFVLVMVLAGGAQSLIGPVVGAIILTGIPEFLRASAQWSMVLYGVFLLAYVYLFRDGLVPLAERGIRALLGRSNAGDTDDATAARGPDKPLPVPFPAASRRPAERSEAIEVQGVSCAFGDNLVLDDISFEARSGEILGVIGPNGAGKTTLFNTLTGNAPLKSGTVRLEGKAITPAPARMAGCGVARTFQHPRVLNGHTVAECIRVASEVHSSSPDKAYLDWVVSICGLGGIMQRRASSLTHYQRRLLTIGMAIAARPKLLLLDEPLAGMDDTETVELKGRIREIHEALGCTILLIEHKLGIVMELCNHLVVLDFGKVIARGEPQAVAQDPKVIEAYLGS